MVSVNGQRRSSFLADSQTAYIDDDDVEIRPFKEARLGMDDGTAVRVQLPRKNFLAKRSPQHNTRGARAMRSTFLNSGRPNG